MVEPQHMAAVRSIAKLLRSTLPAHCLLDTDDLTQEGLIAVHRRGRFQTIRVRGAMLDAIRRADPLGRGVRRHVTRLRQAGSSELATTTDLRAHAAGVGANSVSLDESTGHIALQVASGAVDPLTLLLRRSDAQAMFRAVGQLPDRDQVIIRMIYVDGATIVEVAKELGLSKGRVWFLHEDALQRLRRILTGEPAPAKAKPPTLQSKPKRKKQSFTQASVRVLSDDLADARTQAQVRDVSLPQHLRDIIHHGIRQFETEVGSHA